MGKRGRKPNVGNLVTRELPIDDKMFILQLHGEGAAFERIRQEAEAKFEEKFTPSRVKVICLAPENQVFVERFRDKYLAEVKSVPIANKRIRLDDFQRMRNKLFDMADTVDVYAKDGKNEILKIFQRINDILSAVRDEMEGKPWLLQQINITELSNLTDDELQKRKEVIIAKATGTYQERYFGIGEASEGTEEQSNIQSAKISMAASKGL